MGQNNARFGIISVQMEQGKGVMKEIQTVYAATELSSGMRLFWSTSKGRVEKFIKETEKRCGKSQRNCQL